MRQNASIPIQFGTHTVWCLEVSKVSITFGKSIVLGSKMSITLSKAGCGSPLGG